MNKQEQLIEIAMKMNRCLSVIVDVARRGKTDTGIMRKEYGNIAVLLGEMAKVIFE